MAIFTNRKFKLKTPFQPTGDQPEAIRELVKQIQEKRKDQVLLGVTGSGKTFTMANMVQQLQRPTLVLAPAADAGPDLLIKQYGSYRFLDNARDIGRYFAHKFGTPFPRGS